MAEGQVQGSNQALDIRDCVDDYCCERRLDTMSIIIDTQFHNVTMYAHRGVFRGRLS